ncbi:MAG: hypothetical protein IPJ94_24545 [Chloroflexi bacterium]|nr:hypothetical protein [Chloroflexota bacterium]
MQQLPGAGNSLIRDNQFDCVEGETAGSPVTTCATAADPAHKTDSLAALNALHVSTNTAINS